MNGRGKSPDFLPRYWSGNKNAAIPEFKTLDKGKKENRR
jgi:hypothetical protein